MYKPIKLRDYLRWIRQYGWSMRKDKVDWSLLDRNGNRVCTIKILHPGPKEISAGSVQKTEKELKTRGLL